MGPGHSGQGKRQPEERDRSVTKKVRYLYCWSIENFSLSTCINPYEGLSNKILHFFIYFNGRFVKINFPAVFMKQSKFLQSIFTVVKVFSYNKIFSHRKFKQCVPLFSPQLNILFYRNVFIPSKSLIQG